MGVESFGGSRSGGSQRKKYFKMLLEGRIDEAERFRKDFVPKKLVKFFPLGSELDEARFEMLITERLWFSAAENLNDPYELKGMYLDEGALTKAGFRDFIETGRKMLEDSSRDLAVTALSANSFDSLPMWAHYGGNHKGFCVEYQVVSPDRVYEVYYEPRRIPAGEILLRFRSANSASLMGEAGSDEEALLWTRLTMQQYVIKHESWKYEHEFRAFCPLLGEDTGQLFPITGVGLKTSRIVAGKECSPAHFEKLCEIADSLRCGPVKRIRISENSFALLAED